MGFKDLPPVPKPSNSIGLAYLYANQQCYIFYYDGGDQKLSMAKGKEEKGYNGNAIAVGLSKDYITFNQEPTPTPLAAAFNEKTNEMRVFYVQNDSTIGELKSLDYGDTWDYGALTKAAFSVEFLGGLAACVGDFWRIIIHMKGEPDTLVEIYEEAPGTWVKYIIP